jgi:hypothetical protein
VKSDTLTTVALSHWRLREVNFFCTQDRWEVQTTNVGWLKRILDITAKLFDEHLPQTPVTALGFNFNHERMTRVPDLGRFLASCLVKAQIGLMTDHLVSGELSLRRSNSDRTVNIAVRRPEQAVADSIVSVLNNFEYKFTREIEHFHLRDTIANRYSADQTEAEEQTSRVVLAIDHSVER